MPDTCSSGVPSSRTVPAVGCTTPARISPRVLLPAPFAPTIAISSPGAQVSETPETESRPDPVCLNDTPLSAIRGLIRGAPSVLLRICGSGCPPGDAGRWDLRAAHSPKVIAASSCDLGRCDDPERWATDAQTGIRIPSDRTTSRLPMNTSSGVPVRATCPSWSRTMTRSSIGNTSSAVCSMTISDRATRVGCRGSPMSWASEDDPSNA